ncbi:glycosyl transferase group 1 [Candidatus Moduliflexus flocculans]|uniref:Glycosyl transferase group 1 n=1 Tax=Candidatus Moduliflexus flocculans TaxID=1499966 RepID=A0A081BQR9_9BACT|nr:glycosyl transferase group 1 [Candidatus Moduliflexus flocculans]
MKHKILHISKMNGISGSENHLLTLLANLNGTLFERHLCILTETRFVPQLQEYRQRLEQAGVQVSILVMRRHVDERLIWRLRHDMLAKQIQIVHTHLIHADLYGTIAARLAGVPVIVSSRHNDDQFRRHRALIWLNRLLARWQIGIIVISDWVGRFLQEVEGIPAEKIMRIHYGLDPTPIEALADPTYIRQQFKIPDNVPILGTIGRLTEQKGQTFLLQAISRLTRDVPNLRFIIIGDGELRRELEEQAKTLDIAQNVIFTGLRPYHEAMRLLSGIDLFVFPSLWEGFGLVLLEAMALKKPIVASNISAIPEVVLDGATGRLVPPRDVESLTAAIREFLISPEKRTQCGMAGYARLQNEFTVQTMVRQTASAYLRMYHAAAGSK